MDSSWLKNEKSHEDRIGPTSPLLLLRPGAYINIPTDSVQGPRAVQDAASHWKTSLERFQTVEEFTDEVKRVSTFIEKAKGTGIRVVLINQTWDEYCPAGTSPPPLFKNEHQARICYLGNQAGTDTPSYKFDHNDIGGSWDTGRNPDDETNRELQIPLFVGKNPTGLGFLSVPPPDFKQSIDPESLKRTFSSAKTDTLVSEDMLSEHFHILSLAASLLKMTNREDWNSNLTASEHKKVFELCGKVPAQHHSYWEFFQKVLLTDGAIREQLLRQSLLNLILLSYENQTLKPTPENATEALLKCDDEDIKAAFADFDTSLKHTSIEVRDNSANGFKTIADGSGTKRKIGTLLNEEKPFRISKTLLAKGFLDSFSQL
jgi:hypothetical protein